jgi:hypothetical protein
VNKLSYIRVNRCVRFFGCSSINGIVTQEFTVSSNLMIRNNQLERIWIPQQFSGWNENYLNKIVSWLKVERQASSQKLHHHHLG